MQKEISQRPEEKKKNYELRFVINVLALAIFFVSDLYVMINVPDNIPVLVIVTILFLASIYLALDTVSRSSQEKKSQSDEVYENILKSEKASYLLLKKSFGELSELLEMTDAKSEGATEEIINAQKALAKVIINREKENADALMNSNDDVVAKVAFMENAIAELKPAILQEQQELIKESNDAIVLKIEKLFIELNNMEASMKDGLNEVSIKLSGFQEEIEKMADTLATMVSSIAEQTAVMSSQTASVPVEEQAAVPETAAIDETASIEEPVVTEETAAMEEIEEAVINDIVQEVDLPVEETMPLNTEESAASIVESMMSAGMTGGEDEIKLEEILSIDDIVNSITEEASTVNTSMDSMEVSAESDDAISLNSDINAESIPNLDGGLDLEGIESLDDDVSLDGNLDLSNIEGLDSDVNLDSNLDLSSIEGLDSDISLDSNLDLSNIEGLDSDVNLDSNLDLSNIESLDSDISLDSNLDLSNIEGLDTDINLDDNIDLSNIEGLDTDINLDSNLDLSNI